MKLRFLLSAVAILPVLTPLAPAPAHADDFGCKVLLCILNPQGWSSVGECVPPVERAFRMVAKGKPWPSCPEAGSSGRIGYEQYKPCPAGTAPVTPETVSGGGSDKGSRPDAVIYRPDSNGAFCASPQASNISYGVGRGTSYGSSSAPGVQPRETRSEPNYLDLTTTDGTKRFWFNLRSYQ